MFYYRQGDGKTYKVGFTLPRKNGKRRHFATIKAVSDDEAAEKFKELLYNPEVYTEPGKYELCTGDWKVIKTEELF